METRTISPPTQQDGYEIRYEEWRGHPADPWVPITQAYTVPGGLYIGDPEFAQMLTDNGIVPELRTPESSVCSIGYKSATREWFGWSHRAMFGWKAGDAVANVEIAPADYIVQDEADAKRIACLFAESVS